MMKKILFLTLIACCLFQAIQSTNPTRAEILDESDASCKKYFNDFADDFEKLYPNPKSFKEAY